MKEKVTIRDIAHLAGVSATTVSRVLNQKPHVDPLTRERVIAIMQQHGFVPDTVAVKLAIGRSRIAQPAQPAFPAHFLWGAASSAYQIEGATREDGRGPSIWDTFSHLPGMTYGGQTGDTAADYYHLMRDDVALLAQLGLDAYRFSISWPRIFPDGRGSLNQQGLDFYDRLVDTLLQHAIDPMVTLYHWDLPQALQEQGGWLNRDCTFAFADYAEIVARRLGDRVGWWITHNEPWCTAYLGYGVGLHAPGIQDVHSAVIAAHHLLLSHGLALPRLRSVNQTVQAGIALNLVPQYAADNHCETQRGIDALDRFHNRWFLDPIFRGSYPASLFDDLAVAPPPIVEGDMALIAAPLDYLGINYYQRSLIRTPLRPARHNTTPRYEQVIPVPGASYTEMAWEIYPQGLTDLLINVHRDYQPSSIFITENGAAFEDRWDGEERVADTRRVHFIQEHIQAAAAAVRHNVPLHGYFVWSLMDNYEWIDGYSKRFGLVYIDYATQRRVIKDSGYWYSDFVGQQRERRQTFEQNSYD
jgi:beta-glucosidase